MCRRPAAHHQHHLHARPATPRPAADDLSRTETADADLDLRVGDREREAAATALREHAAAGRLSVAEHEERLEAALAARTGRDLHATLADLPALPHQAAAHAQRPAPRPDRREPLAAVVGPWLVVSLALVLVWAFSGAGTFWPVWPILGWGIAVALRVLGTLRPTPRRVAAP